MDSGLLKVADVAAELKTTDVAVMRLIARRRIAANSVRPKPSPSDWRITKDALVSYVTGGTKDLQMPEMKDETWFNTNQLQVGYGLSEAIHTATMEQEFDNAAATAFANRRENRNGNNLERQLTVTPAVREIIATATPLAEGFPSRPMLEPPFRTWGETYLALLLDVSIRKALSHAGTPSLLRLYKTPDEYDRLVREALDAIAAQRITFRRPHQVTQFRHVTITYFLPHTAIAARQAMNGIAEVLY